MEKLAAAPTCPSLIQLFNECYCNTHQEPGAVLDGGATAGSKTCPRRPYLHVGEGGQVINTINK